MAELPRGRYPGRLDDKNRLKLPSDFIQFLKTLRETKMFLTSVDRRIVQLYPIAEWRVTEHLLNTSKANPAVTKKMAFNAQDLGADVEMDTQGRITFHPDLRETLGLDGKQLHLMSVKGHVDILTDDIYQERRRAALDLKPEDIESIEVEGMR